VRTRRYAGEHATDADNNVKLLAALRGLPAPRRGARYVCALALAIPESAGPRRGLSVIVTRGTCRGRIATEPRGSRGFGYDPIFEPESEPPGGRTLGLWSAAEKHAISHRARAARRMAPRLIELGF
jgi:XTP/dITP diphosphohydrolase